MSHIPLQVGQVIHHVTEKALKTKEGQAVITSGAGVLMAVAPVLTPAVAVGAVTIGIGVGVHYAIHKVWDWFHR